MFGQCRIALEDASRLVHKPFPTSDFGARSFTKAYRLQLEFDLCNDAAGLCGWLALF